MGKQNLKILLNKSLLNKKTSKTILEVLGSVELSIDVGQLVTEATEQQNVKLVNSSEDQV